MARIETVTVVQRDRTADLMLAATVLIWALGLMTPIAYGIAVVPR